MTGCRRCQGRGWITALAVVARGRREYECVVERAPCSLIESLQPLYDRVRLS